MNYDTIFLIKELSDFAFVGTESLSVLLLFSKNSIMNV